MNELSIALIALACGWLGSMAKSYFLEKGKNLATKEDIQEITEKVEFVKNQFSKKHLRSKAYIERQILAYDKICQHLNEIKKLSYKTDEKIEFVDKHNSKVCKAKHTLAMILMQKSDEHHIYTSPYIQITVANVAESLYELSKTEYFSSLMEKPEERRAAVLSGWNNVRDLVDDTQFQIRRELSDE